MKLYYSPGACSLASRIAFQELGIDVEYELVNLETKLTVTGSDFLKINPLGYVPALELDDGSVLTENSAILPFIADLRPGTLAPKEGTFDRVRLTQALGFLSGELHKSFSPFFAGVEGVERDKAAAKLASRIAHVERQIGQGRDYLVGDQISVADIYAFVLLSWSSHIGISLEKWPAINAFLARVGRRDAVRNALRQEGLLEEAA